jgi:hypothetical protein
MARVPFPLLPKSVGLVVFVFIITMTTLYFDYYQDYRTNPVVFYSIPILYLIVAMKKDSWANITKAWGLHFETLEDKVASVLSLPLGVLIGLVTYQIMSSRLAIVPLWFPEFLQTLPLTSNIIFFSVVAFGEEVFSIVIGKNFANWFAYNFDMSEVPAIFTGFLMGRLVWAGTHFMAYGGLQNPLLYIVAFALGMIFTAGSYTIAVLSGRKWSLPLAFAAHLAFDVATTASLTCILPVCL